MSKSKKDIVLLLGDGGMMGVFVAGFLSVLDKSTRDRVESVYGTSSGADVGVYFVSDQTTVPLRFFTEHLTSPDFIRKNFLRYLLKLFIFRNSRRVQIPDYLNVAYVVAVAKNSDCKLDMRAFERSDIGFYVKVIDVTTGEPVYLVAKTNVFEKLMATSQCGPLSSQAIEIEGRRYIDGGTFASGLDMDLVRSRPDTVFIAVQSQRDVRLSKVLLYPLYLLAGHAISILYGQHLGKKYVQRLFMDATAELRSQKNVIFVENDLCYSSFCTDKKKLMEVYEHGIHKAQIAISSLRV